MKICQKVICKTKKVGYTENEKAHENMSENDVENQRKLDTERNKKSHENMSENYVENLISLNTECIKNT